MDRKQFDRLRSAISSFCKINFFQISMETKKPTGLFCTVFTEVKKDETLERVKQIILDLKFPFEVTQHGLFLTKHFVIKFPNV